MEFGKNNTPFEMAEFARRLAVTKERMAAAGLDVLIVCDPANMNYLTGYDGWSFYVHQAVLVSLDLDGPIWFGRGQDVNGRGAWARRKVHRRRGGLLLFHGEVPGRAAPR